MIADTYFEQIETAQNPSDLFKDAESARSTYRRLARFVHPDTNANDSRAQAAFEKLADLWNQYNGTSSTVSPHPTQGIVFESKRFEFHVADDPADRGTIANVYRALYAIDGREKYAALKIPRSPKYNDLITNEVKSLKLLRENVKSDYWMYHPQIEDTFMHNDIATGKTRRIVATTFLDDFVSLRDVINAHPNGISGKHVAWIARRLWVALDTAHDAGLSHNAVFPENVMIHPSKHGVVLVDWAYSQQKSEKLKFVIPSYYESGWYGKNYDKPLDHRLDVCQAAFTLESLFAGQEARPFRAFFNGCRVASAPSAGELFMEFDELLERLYGKRRYIPFTMPEGWKRAV